jgi:uncharacterized membrane protein
MNMQLRRLRGVIGIALIWATVWAALFTVLTGILQLFLPFDSDVGTFKLMSIIGWVGLISGGIFGILLSLNESGKAIRNLSLVRVMMWGILSSAVYPLVTQRANQVFWTCTFGVLVALSLIALARKAARSDLVQPKQLLDIFLACALLPVQDAVSSPKEISTN